MNLDVSTAGFKAILHLKARELEENLLITAAIILPPPRYETLVWSNGCLGV
jgi:hypothetical protein